jgi:ADP-ribosyl-[dinitrogen reductase] hydrolase
MTTFDKCLGAFIGLAIGDAMGAPVEFSPPGTFEPVTGYREGGPFNLPSGYWTDDTSQAVCLAESFIHCNGQINLGDQMRRYSNWYEYGRNSSTGVCFDIGNGTLRAIETFLVEGSLGLYPENSKGNGSLMRLSPVSIVYHKSSEGDAVAACDASSSTTHGHLASDLCKDLGRLLHRYLNGTGEKPEVSPEGIENSGYAPKSLNAALYHFGSTSSFEEAILQAVNYGDDSDTVAAITGQLAGAYYGYKAIPRRWISGLHDSERLLLIASTLYDLSFGAVSPPCFYSEITYNTLT